MGSWNDTVVPPAVVRDQNQDIVKNGPFNATLLTQVGAAIVALLTVIDPGGALRAGLKVAIIIAAIAAFAIITAADILARTWAVVGTHSDFVTLPAVGVRYIPAAGADDAGWLLAGMRSNLRIC
ncbi:MAG: hypothetical protein M3065_05685 [Actinomycetota bacterium]|nr:hypothetical protein [Actinomycetota bacterium]